MIVHWMMELENIHDCSLDDGTRNIHDWSLDDGTRKHTLLVTG
jgi:hypothetical protein